MSDIKTTIEKDLLTLETSFHDEEEGCLGLDRHYLDLISGSHQGRWCERALPALISRLIHHDWVIKFNTSAFAIHSTGGYGGESMLQSIRTIPGKTEIVRWSGGVFAIKVEDDVFTFDNRSISSITAEKATGHECIDDNVRRPKITLTPNGTRKGSFNHEFIIWDVKAVTPDTRWFRCIIGEYTKKDKKSYNWDPDHLHTDRTAYCKTLGDIAIIGTIEQLFKYMVDQGLYREYRNEDRTIVQLVKDLDAGEVKLIRLSEHSDYIEDADSVVRNIQTVIEARKGK